MASFDEDEERASDPREREIEQLEAAWKASPGDVLVCVVLDMSGSMGSVWDETIEAFNEYVNGLKMKGEPAHVSLVMFDDEYMPRYFNRAVDDVPVLTKQTYAPRGSTALFDAMGRCITETASLRHRPERVLIVTITDGGENASREYGLRALQRLIQARKTEGWEFLYLSAAPDAFAEPQRLGISQGRMLRFQADAAGMNAMRLSMERATELYRRTGSSDLRDLGYTDDVSDVPEGEEA